MNDLRHFLLLLSSSIAYRLANFRSPPQRLRHLRIATAIQDSFIERTSPSSLYGDEQGASAFPIIDLVP